MQLNDQVIHWLEKDIYRMNALKAASSLDLPDWCLAAGFVRNLIWDKLHGNATATLLNDIDLIYFNPHDLSVATDLELELQLKSISDHPWSVKNQARMHIRNNDKPYSSTSDAMSFWVEIETAVGACYSNKGGISIVAPFGLEANFSHTITLNEKRPKKSDFIDRISGKNWQILWPKLEIKG